MRKTIVSFTVAAILLFAISSFVRADDPPAATDAATKLAHQMSDAVMHQDTGAAEKLLDSDALFDRFSAGVNAPADFQAGFKQGFHEQAHALMDSIVKASAGGSYHFLRARQVNGETHVLFRLLPKAGGYNYHDWIVIKDPQGNLKFQDAYLAISGELLSQTLHRVYIQAALGANPGLVDRMLGKDKEIAANMSKLLQLLQDQQDGKSKELLDDYDALPASMKQEKICMVMRLTAAEKLRKQSPKAYSDAMADYRALFPLDPSVDLDCLDALLENKQYADARQSLDRLDAFTGGDAYLLFLRGNTYKLEAGSDNLALAKQSYQKAIDQEPTLSQAYWAMVSLSLQTEEYEQTAALLTEISQKFHAKIKDLTKLPTYAGFVKSDAYKKWIAAQAPAAPTTQP